MILAITVAGVCAGGGHVTLNVTRGTETRQITLLSDDFAFEPSEYDTVLATLIRSRIKESGATTKAQIRTAIESKDCYL